MDRYDYELAAELIGRLVDANDKHGEPDIVMDSLGSDGPVVYLEPAELRDARRLVGKLRALA